MLTLLCDVIFLSVPKSCHNLRGDVPKRASPPCHPSLSKQTRSLEWGRKIQGVFGSYIAGVSVRHAKKKYCQQTKVMRCIYVVCSNNIFLKAFFFREKPSWHSPPISVQSQDLRLELGSSVRSPLCADLIYFL